MPISKFIACALAAMVSAAPAVAQAQKTSPQKTLRTRTSAPKPSVSNLKVVPGVSIGRVALGDSLSEVRRKMGAPVTSFKLNSGLTSDLWRSPLSKRWDGQPNTFEVVYRRDVVIQIEATSTSFTTARGLGLKSSDAAWQRAFGKRDESKQYKYVGGKSDQGYDDWIAAGFALEYQFLPSDGSGDPPVQMHTLIVHYKGVPVIPDPGGS